MEIKQLNEFPRAAVEQLLAAVPFYKTVRQHNPWQFEVLLQHSRVVNFSPGEVVFHCGEKDNWLYFLLKGQLTVYVCDEIATADAVNYITPGEVFGDLAMLAGNERTATLVADPNCKEVVAFGTDFTIFGKLDDFHSVSLQTKLAYYRNSVHSLRWKLEVYRSKYPQHSLADNHHNVRLYSGKKDSLTELKSLHRQAVQLTRLLLRWNREFGSPIASAAFNPRLVASME